MPRPERQPLTLHTYKTLKLFLGFMQNRLPQWNACANLNIQHVLNAQSSVPKKTGKIKKYKKYITCHIGKLLKHGNFSPKYSDLRSKCSKRWLGLQKVIIENLWKKCNSMSEPCRGRQNVAFKMLLDNILHSWCLLSERVSRKSENTLAVN